MKSEKQIKAEIQRIEKDILDGTSRYEILQSRRKALVWALRDDV